MLISKFIDYIQKHEPTFVPSLILDIGSRDLEQSEEFDVVWKDCDIVAFEPTPNQYNICEDKSHRYTNIKVHNLALSNYVGKVDFWVTDGNIGCSSILEPIHVPFGSQDKNKIEVDAITLKEFMLLNPQLDTTSLVVWMDVQGHELSVLEGFGDIIKNTKYIHLEAAQIAYYKGHSSKESIEKFLTDNGFEFEFYAADGHPFGEGDIMARRVN